MCDKKRKQFYEEWIPVKQKSKKVLRQTPPTTTEKGSSDESIMGSTGDSLTARMKNSMTNDGFDDGFIKSNDRLISYNVTDSPINYSNNSNKSVPFSQSSGDIDDIISKEKSVSPFINIIKDNHIAVAGGVAAALRAAKQKIGHLVKIEIEVDTLDQLHEALSEDVDVVLLDNMSLTQLAEAVRMINKQALSEASGGISLDTVAAVAETGVDLISVGALTHSAPILDVGLDIHI